MTDPIDETFARMLHHRAETLEPGDPLMPPIAPASLYYLPGEPQAEHQYGRWTNPTWSAFEDALATLEDAPCIAFPSGMAAIAAVVMGTVKTGDTVLLPSDGYMATRVLADTYLAPRGVNVEFCPQRDFEGRNFDGIAMLFVETPTNPELHVVDIAAIASRAKAAGALLVVDNTTATCLVQRPLDLGADVVVAADSKALNGHSDVLMGHVATRDEAIAEQVRTWRKLVGAIPGHFEAWLAYRGLKTFDVRFERMCNSALALAERLSAHPAISNVSYPGLPSHPGHKIAARQMRRFGSVVSMEFTDAEAADGFIENARYIVPSTSFGGVHTTAERRARWGDAVAPGFLRLSVGCEPLDALWPDMEQALNRLD
ncbi:cystathionine gamma-lyase [Erythrobacter sp. MTPC3]|uniref:cystathionine gamma-lyase n=1 Tax=Erythrobacter sp. MTPC3 TaxID=3056564 RepID=UPI0036F1B7F5